MAAVVWFRRDLRLDDNPAWASATRDHDRVVPLFIVDKRLWDAASDRRRNLLASHLTALDRTLVDLGGRLRVEAGSPEQILREIAGSGSTVYFNADYTPYASDRDRSVAGPVPNLSVHHGNLVHPPGMIQTSAGSPYRVFSPYWRRWHATAWEPVTEGGVATIDGDTGIGVPDHDPVAAAGETGAAERLARFLNVVDRYVVDRDMPAADATSRLSADLKFGTIGPRRVLEEVGDATEGRVAFIRQIAWRDFYAQVLFDRSDTVDRPFRMEYDAIEWRNDPAEIEAWKSGQTGFPIVDAGMRQLASEGFMHNRVRMITASFLVKDLLVDWRIGERWFRHHLMDADVAQNVGNWQWVAGTGVDAAPYFRVFNPTTQSRRFDPDGSYIRRWVPELSDVSSRTIHAPWTKAGTDADLAALLASTGYPQPMVDHSRRRQSAIDAFSQAREEIGDTPPGCDC